MIEPDTPFPPLNGLAHRDVHRILGAASLDAMLAESERMTVSGFGSIVTYSPKVFIPLTRLCRDVCHYCTFATTPRLAGSPFLTAEEVMEIARQGAAAGCREALFTLGDRPEDRYDAAKDWLERAGYFSTLDYLAAMARMVHEETGLLAHLNPGLLSARDYAALRPVSASMGIMLESTAQRLCEPGG